MMKSKVLVIFTVAIFWVGNSVGIESKISASPSALIPQPVYEFESIADGVQLTHDYLIKNRGTAILEIQKVKTD